MKSEFGFKKGQPDNVYFGELYKFLAEFTSEPQWTAQEYKEKLTAAAYKLIEDNGKSYFASVVTLDCIDIILAFYRPDILAKETDEPAPWPEVYVDPKQAQAMQERLGLT